MRVLGVNPLQGSGALYSRMGTVYGIYPWVGALVMGNLMGRFFWVGCGWFFWVGRGGEEKGSVFTGRRAFLNSPIFYVVYYISIE